MWVKLGSVACRNPLGDMLTEPVAVPSLYRLLRAQVFLVIGLSVKLQKFGDEVHLADELIPTYVGVLACLLIYCERTLQICS